MAQKAGSRVKKLSKGERLAQLYDEVTVALRDVVDPLARLGRTRKRPFNLSTANRVDRLWEQIEGESVGSAEMLVAYKELVEIYELYGTRGWNVKITERLRERIAPLMEQIRELEEA